MFRSTLCIAFLLLVVPLSGRAQSFVHWETPHVSPLTMTPDGSTLLAVNTPDARLEVFGLTASGPVHLGAVPVGLDPVSVRARTNTEVWVVNHISDSVSIVDLSSRRVLATLETLDEPADVVFAGSPQRAFISCSQANTVMVFDPANLEAAPILVPLEAEDPRAMTVSEDGSKVYVAIFQSGNGTTALRGRLVVDGSDVTPLNHPSGPYGGLNPPPNDGSDFLPMIRPEFLPDGAQPAPQVSLIVQKQGTSWFDDNGTDWTDWVSGSFAPVGLRPEGWDLLDRDVAVIDTAGLTVEWIEGLMTTDMALAVHPQSGAVTVVGTDADNLTRFEPNLAGRFIRVLFASALSKGAPTIADLNSGHLTYSDAQIAEQSNPVTADQALRDLSIGDPRGLVWRTDGSIAYVAGMGSNNVVAIDAAGARVPGIPPIEVGEGPTGLAIDEARSRLYVLDKFAAGLSVVDLGTHTEIERLSFFDPSPPAIREGRPFLYDTHRTSGLGHVACASCHIDGRMDRLAWDLGDPQGTVKPIGPQHNRGMDVPGLNTQFLDFHPMKGPMITQTLVDIIGKEPLHWRGDRDGLEEFNGAFQSLQGDDTGLDAAEMQGFEDFLATLHFPPNPNRTLDNGLPTDLPLPGQFSDGRFAGQGGLAAGEPMPNGNAQRGLELFRPPNITAFAGLACSSCHTMPTGAGSDHALNDAQTAFAPIPPGPNGENQLALFVMDGTVESTIKVPQLRNLHEKTGFETTGLLSHQGFGYEHDGVTDTLTRFHMHPTFFLPDDQGVSDVVALMMSFSGSDLPEGSTAYGPFLVFEPPGPPSQDAHAAVGRQLTVTAANKQDTEVIDRLLTFRGLADSGAVDLIAKGMNDGEARGYAYAGGGLMQSDRASESLTLDALRTGIGAGEETTFTVVPTGSATRLGIDRDLDGALDRDELDGCGDPADPLTLPSASCIFMNGFESGSMAAWHVVVGAL